MKFQTNMDVNQQIQELQQAIDRMRADLDSLTGEFYKNNFSGTQDFSKSSRFNTALKVPHYTATPTTSEVGQIIEIGGKLYICSASGVWDLVGSQV